jgi:23S rRNA-/tRNA-specific pseudouridylate synthase
MAVRDDVKILYRDQHLLVLDKPSGIATTAPGNARTLVEVARELDPAAPRLHPSSRLDAEVSGVVTFARTETATVCLLAARKAGRYLRGYLGIASGAPSAEAGEWRGAIGLDPRDSRKRRVVADDAPGARSAWSRFTLLAARERCALLWLEPQTGRTHQLRLHCAHAGLALYGDRPYGGPQRLVLADGSVVSARRTMLHCCRVSLPAIEGEGVISVESEPAQDLKAFWKAAGGAAIVLPNG